MTVGVSVTVGEGVIVGVSVAVGVAVAVGVSVAVAVAVGGTVAVNVGVLLGVIVGVAVGGMAALQPTIAQPTSSHVMMRVCGFVISLCEFVSDARAQPAQRRLSVICMTYKHTTLAHRLNAQNRSYGARLPS